MKLNLRRRYLSVAVAMGTITGLSGLPASATEVSMAQPDPAITVIDIPMEVIGFDVDVARANGYEIITDENGEQKSVPVTAEARAVEAQLAPIRPAENEISPRSTVVTGTCGSSRIVINDSYRYRFAGISTSFNVNRPAVAYTWYVDITGNSTSTRRPFGGGLMMRTSWQNTFDHTVPRPGTYFASVSRTSHAILNNGSICASGGPSDTAYIS